MSQILFLWLSHTLIPRLQNTGIGPRILSDHAPYWVELKPYNNPPLLNWRLNPFWLTILPDTDRLAMEWGFFFNNNAATSSPLTVWETFKIHARMLLTEYISRFRRDSKSGYVQATAQLTELEGRYVTSPSPTSLAKLKLQTRAVDVPEASLAQAVFLVNKGFLNRVNARVNCWPIWHIWTPVVITLRSHTESILTDPNMIVREFDDFFQEVYTI